MQGIRPRSFGYVVNGLAGCYKQRAGLLKTKERQGRESNPFLQLCQCGG
jgi:hypothetical protein